MKWRLACVGQDVVNLCPTLDKKLAESPVSVKAGAAEIEVLAECSECFPVRKKKLDGTNVTEIGAVADQGHTI